jgi:hypothetical protein
MAGGNRYVLEDMTWPEVHEALSHVQAALIPTGSIEQQWARRVVLD